MVGIDKFKRHEQYLFNIFAFTIAWPPLKIGVNISFYVFILLVGSILNRRRNPIKTRTNFQRLLWLFLTLGVFTTILKRPSDLIENQFVSDFLLLFNYVYWITLCVFIVSNKDRIDLSRFSKYYFFGSIFLIIFYYLPGLPTINNIFIQFPVIKGRNVLVYQLINIVPISIIYIHSKRGVMAIGVILSYLGVMLYSNGRAGSIILLIMSTLLLLVVYPKYSRFLKNCFFVLSLGFITIYSSNDSKYLASLARPIENISPRLAEMIRKEGNGVASNDRSWLIREVMVRKGLMIAKEHPILGIGFNRFRNYNTDFTELLTYERRYDRLGDKGTTNTTLNNRSPHNSYIQILAENGFLGLFIFLLILAIPLKVFIQKLLKNQLHIYDAPLISALGLAMYLYVISSYPSAITFVTISLAYNSAKMQVAN